MTAYRTTLLADGQDYALLRATVIDKNEKEIKSAKNALRIYVEGNAWISRNGKDESLPSAIDSTGRAYFENKLDNGVCLMDFYAGKRFLRTGSYTRYG